MKELKLTVKPEASQLLAGLGYFLAREGVRSFLVGGFVRDMLLGRETADIDITVADALAVAARVAGAFGGKYVPLDEVNGIGRVVLPDSTRPGAGGKWEIDFSTLKGDIEQDLADRDFTIDAMAIELAETTGPTTLSTPRLLDPFRGQEDIRRRIIRAVRATVFESDAARLLRAVRLAAELDFKIDRGTEALLRHHHRLIQGVAGERVREELLRILALPGAAKQMAYLDELGLLAALIPEMDPARGVSQPPVHYWDVFEHSVQTVAAVDFLLRQGVLDYAGDQVLAMVPWSAALSEYFGREVNSGSIRSSLLKLAAFLHDIAKPQTKTIEAAGRARFLGHPGEGSVMVIGILERLRFSTRETGLLELMVKHHLRPGQISHNELPSHRAIYRYFRDTGDAAIDILYLSLADHLATRGPTLDLTEWQWHTQITGYVLSQYFAESSAVAPVKLIDGHDLINIFGLTPGPRIGELLEAVREAQAAGEINTREEALAYIGHLISAAKLKDKQM
ncbi:MAG: HD domain-containing protein [Chloroflexi bacterium]|nr:HD domain-containing protein [Chloroflexota bacterium]